MGFLRDKQPRDGFKPSHKGAAIMTTFTQHTIETAPEGRHTRRFHMQLIRTMVLGVLVLLLTVVTGPAYAVDYTNNTPGLVGYDPVAYFTDGKPVRGSGYHVTVHDGVTYVFTTEEHKKMFEANPQKYLPAYGGYCAYGVAVGEKFVLDPEAGKIVDGVLYFNLGKDIQKKRAKDISRYIKKEEAHSPKNKDKAAGDL